VLLEFVTRRIADGGVLYLAGFDRWITSHAACRGYVRYMDDMVVWCQTRSEAKALLMCAGEILWDIWKLRLKGQSQINRASAGLPFCGYRIYPGMIRLTRRKKLIYRRIVSHWEERYRLGSATTAQLQAGIASALAAVQAAESVSWRRGELQRSQFGEI
jgi:hypothetical protein